MAKWVRRIAGLLVLCGLFVAAAYGYFEHRSGKIANELGLAGGYANALKHAGAAASLYHALSSVGVGHERAESIVITLGEWNECGETFVKRGRKDTTAEMSRDLYHNMAGISAARWGAQLGFGPEGAVRRLALTPVLFADASELGPILSPEMREAGARLDLAIGWSRANRTVLDEAVRAVFLKPAT